MWILQILTTIWDSFFTIPIGNLGFTFGEFTIGVFVLSFIASTVYKFMHRGNDK